MKHTENTPGKKERGQMEGNYGVKWGKQKGQATNIM